MIKLTHTKAQMQDLNILNLYQTPLATLQNFWEGSTQDYNEYLANYHLNLDWNVDNLHNLHNRVNESFEKMIHAVNKNVSEFNFKIRNALKPRNLVALELQDYMKLEIDISNEDKETQEKLIQTFLSMNTRSFVDFREIQDSKLILIYNRRGMYDEGDRIAVCKAKTGISLKDNFKIAKDNNFIVSGVVKELALACDCDFMYEYQAGIDTKRMIATSDEISQLAQIKQDSNKQLEAIQAIKEQAKLEIVKENALNRISLKEDSNYDEISKESNTEIKLQNTINKQDDIQTSIEYYSNKEIEKVKLRLEKAKTEAIVVYKELRAKIESGMGILESLNILKQKYREEHTVNLASIYLGRDLQDIPNKENVIKALESEILQKEQEIKEKDKEITKREDAIYNLKSTLGSKEVEIRNIQYKFDDTLQELQKETQETLSNLTQEHKKEKEVLEQDLSIADELIQRKTQENTQLQHSLDSVNLQLTTQLQELQRLRDENKEIYAKNISLQELNKQTNDFLHESKTQLHTQECQHNQEIKDLQEKAQQEYKTQQAQFAQQLSLLEKAKEEYIVKNTELYTQNNLLNKEIIELKTMLKELQDKNDALEKILQDAQNPLQNTTNAPLNLSESTNNLESLQNSKVNDILSGKIRKQ